MILIATIAFGGLLSAYQQPRLDAHVSSRGRSDIPGIQHTAGAHSGSDRTIVEAAAMLPLARLGIQLSATPGCCSGPANVIRESRT